ncbi:Leucinostatins biosynthesis cluster protein T [Pseudocercospora fuligena]|uniref:Leucinostatins biosynthesis cluster protein T n=1 Tax=Pseudocercospora fuligena TaxID=685502 RepID=A0A8H6VEM2_9PEZI|nr:Leucinostatins biosynthesis cluster protein T [Pseudocercospora fuligena]
MKIILSGATGFIGSAVLQRLISLPEITSILVLSRRPLEVKNPKIQTVIVEDFHNYKQHELDQLSGAEACIWVLGSAKSGMDVHMDMTMAAAEAFEKMGLGKEGKDFRFVYTSGAFVERDQNKSLWLLSEKRKARGTVEDRVMDLEKQYGQGWKPFIVRPGFVTVREPTLSPILGNLYVPVGELAAAMVDAAVNGGEKQILDNADLRQYGKAALQRKPSNVLEKQN